jgi:hypothetical protein
MYAPRAIPLSYPDDVVQLHPGYKRAYPYFVEHLQQIGLPTATQIIWDLSAEVANELPDYKLSCYRFAPALHRVRPNRRRLDATERFNNKNLFIAFCEEHGYPVPPTLIVRNDQPLRHFDITFPVYFKAATMAAGLCIFRCETEQELRARIKTFKGEYQVQAEVPDIKAFLSVQYIGQGGAAIHLATSEQILNDVTHVGNRYPTRYNPRAITDPLADKLAKAGLEDVFGIDLVATPHGYQILECNARITSATYPTVVAQRLGITNWTTYKMPIRHASLKGLDLHTVAFDPKKGYGAIIINDSFMSASGEVSVLFAGPEAAQTEAKTKLAALLG